MAKKYNHYCGIARTFEVLGERWTPLVVRELMYGGRRFSDIMEGLPGVGTSTLANRLKHLESEGVVQRSELPPPAASALYELTESGMTLARAMLPLSMWGSRRLPQSEEARKDMFCEPRWLLIWFHMAFDPEKAKGIRETYELRVEDEVFRVEVRDGEMKLSQQLRAQPADLVLTMSADTLITGLTGRQTFEEGLQQGKVAVDGSPEAMLRFTQLFLPEWLMKMRATY